MLFEYFIIFPSETNWQEMKFHGKWNLWRPNLIWCMNIDTDPYWPYFTVNISLATTHTHTRLGLISFYFVQFLSIVQSFSLTSSNTLFLRQLPSCLLSHNYESMGREAQTFYFKHIMINTWLACITHFQILLESNSLLSSHILWVPLKLTST